MTDELPTNEQTMNNALGKLERINLWWTTAHKSKIFGEVETFYECLEALYNEGYPYFSPNERKSIERELKIIENHLDAQHFKVGNPHPAVWRRKASNRCDVLARTLTTLFHKYGVERLQQEGVVYRE